MNQHKYLATLLTNFKQIGEKYLYYFDLAPLEFEPSKSTMLFNFATYENSFLRRTKERKYWLLLTNTYTYPKGKQQLKQSIEI